MAAPSESRLARAATITFAGRPSGFRLDRLCKTLNTATMLGRIEPIAGLLAGPAVPTTAGSEAG